MCNHGRTDRGAVWDVGSHTPKASPVRRGPDPMWEGAILVDRGAHCKVYAFYAVNCAKTSEPIDLPFRLWTPVAEGCISSIVFTRWRQCALMAGNIAATWRIRLNHRSTAAIRLMSHYFDQLLSWTRPLRQSHR